MNYLSFSVKGINGEGCVTAYLPENSESVDIHKKRPLILIVPGGAYEHVSFREGEPVALKFLAKGYAVAVLTYSVAPAVYPEALVQLGRAVLTFKEKAACYAIDPGQIYVMGFSAGAHLAASLSVLGREPEVRTPLGLSEKETEALSIRGQILCYPVITSGVFAHKGSFVNLTGRRPETDPLWEKLSLEKHVRSDLPMTFIWHTMTDEAVPVENSLLFARALHDAGVLTELHIFAKGAHGASLGTEESTTKETGRGEEPQITDWPEMVDRFIHFYGRG